MQGKGANPTSPLSATTVVTDANSTEATGTIYIYLIVKQSDQSNGFSLDNQ